MSTVTAMVEVDEDEDAVDHALSLPDSKMEACTMDM